MIRALLLALGIIHAPPVLTAAAPEFNEAPAAVSQFGGWCVPIAGSPEGGACMSEGTAWTCSEATLPETTPDIPPGSVLAGSAITCIPGSGATVRPHG